jgi:hypothetical protein
VIEGNQAVVRLSCPVFTIGSSGPGSDRFAHLEEIFSYTRTVSSSPRLRCIHGPRLGPRSSSRTDQGSHLYEMRDTMGRDEYEFVILDRIDSSDHRKIQQVQSTCDPLNIPVLASDSVASTAAFTAAATLDTASSSVATNPYTDI